MKRATMVCVCIFLSGFVFYLLELSIMAQTLELEYSTYIGGSDDDFGNGVSLSTDGAAYVVGETSSSDFPTKSSYQAIFGGSYDAFVINFDSSGSSLIYSTYLGGIAGDIGESIVLGTDGTAYLIGVTSSIDFPTKNSYQAELDGSYDSFVSRVNPSGSTLNYSTYLGGLGGDYGYEVTLSTDGTAYIVGYTSSINFPTENSYQVGIKGVSDAFVSRLGSSGSTLIYSTYLGGSDGDCAYGITLSTDGTAHIVGETFSTDFPTERPYQAGSKGLSDAFVSRLDSSGSTLIYSTYLGGSDGDFGKGIRLSTDMTAYLIGNTFSINFPTENSYQECIGGGSDAFVSRLGSSGSTLIYSTYLGGSGGDHIKGIGLSTDMTAYLIGNTSSTNFPTERPYQADFKGGADVYVSRLSSSGSTLIYSTYLGGSSGDYGNGITIGTSGTAYITGYTRSNDFPTKNPFQSEKRADYDAFVSKLNFIIPTPSVTPTPSITPTASVTPTPSITPTASVTPTPSTTSTVRKTPTPWITPTPTASPYIPLAPWIYDYNGDGTSDIAIFRPSSGLWAIRGITRVYFGNYVDEPIPGDYNGDRTTDIGVFRSSSGLWAIRSITRAYFGSTGDLPEPGDYGGDGTTDISIYRSYSGLWAIRGVTRVYFGGATDIPASGYYDGDTTKDIGIYRGSSGLWAIRNVTHIYFGSLSDMIVPGDYDGDGTWDYGIFRNSSSLWAIRGITRCYFGSSIDEPIPADYTGDSKDDIGIFRETSGLWAIRNISRAYFGGTGDIPVTR